MNDSLKNIINFSSQLTAQLKATEKLSNIMKIQSQYSEISEVCKKFNSINLKIEQSDNLFSRCQNLANAVVNTKKSTYNPLDLYTSVNSGGMSNTMLTLRQFIRTQKYFEECSKPLKLSYFSSYPEINTSDTWNNYPPKLANFNSSFKKLEYYETLHSFAEYDIAKNNLLKNKISQKVEKVLNGSISYSEGYSNSYQFTQGIIDRDLTRHQHHLENLKNFIINGGFDFTYTHGLEDFLWTHFTKIEELEETINRSVFELEFLNKIIISISNSLKKSALNKRDFFRKINSFYFKNLDDEHHSYSLTA
ncbi:hypothetical protein [Flavobacterium muglaense]|uniref:Uncharacterized protein n=1 Tax=Flavobacterium muglaense TaxID=2764716 RepID=A0A923MYY5_9FLAO|nr:hypothetical protein [Flavobacterium muglaense]MBC5837576.1 hypothetical protein [Flavobacterium muglaense]MBC5844102.1 hypothetical protein [Flavobacterium muglaense]